MAVMQRPEELERELEAGRPQAVYVLMGPAEYLVDRFVRRLVRETGSVRVPVDASQVSPDEVRASALVPDLFATARVVHVQSAEAWPAKDRKTFLAAVAGNLAPGLRVALTIDARRPSQGKLPEGVRAAFFWNPFPSALPRLADEFLRSHGGRPGRGVGELLVDFYGADLRRLDQEARKLAVTAGDAGVVDVALVRALCAAPAEDRGFVVAETVTSRDRPRALREVEGLMEGEGPHALLAMLANRMRRMRLLRDLVDQDPAQGRRAREAARELAEADRGTRRLQAKRRADLQAELAQLGTLAPAGGDLEGVHPRQLPGLMEHADGYSLAELDEGLRACARADRRLKGEAGDLGVVMTELVVALT